LGLAKDRKSIGDLVEIVGDRRSDDELRGYSAIALGHIGIGGERVLRPIRNALTERRSEKLRRATATALGMLTDPRAVPILLAELGKARSQSAKGQVVIALAQVGDERAIEPLTNLLKDHRQQHLTRALACAGLGIVGDVAWVPSLSLIGRDVNYRASGDLMNECLSIL
nr:HEAT repeat domain-containing protein [Planctomycetota bacterium]